MIDVCCLICVCVFFVCALMNVCNKFNIYHRFENHLNFNYWDDDDEIKNSSSKLCVIRE